MSENNELVVDINESSQGNKFINYKSIESIKKEDFSLLFVDCDIFYSIDLVQFFLSKNKKKILDIPVILILRVNLLNEIEMDWYFDDFILFPFRKGEVSTRIKRLLMDSGVDEDSVVVGHLKINLNEYSVYLGNERIELTYKEFEILKTLVQNRGIVFSRKDLLQKIWGIEYIGGTRTVDVHIRRLRGKLGDEFNSIIETVRNVGYKCME